METNDVNVVDRECRIPLDIKIELINVSFRCIRKELDYLFHVIESRNDRSVDFFNESIEFCRRSIYFDVESLSVYIPWLYETNDVNVVDRDVVKNEKSKKQIRKEKV